MRANVERATPLEPQRLSVGPMLNSDVRAVMRIEGLSFSSSWPTSAFHSELNDNKLAHYFVGRPEGRDEIVAYGGIWVILEDAHITTLAAHPDHRGKRYGEQLLLHMLREAIARGGSWITLEARESNVIAQSLYAKYGFSAISTRRAYYSDNGENAVVMWAGHLRSEAYLDRLAYLERELARRLSGEER